MVITIIATGSRSAFLGPVCCRSMTFWYGSGIRIRGSVPLTYRSVSRFGSGSGSCSGSGAAFPRPVLWICDILVKIRILRSVPLTYGSVSRSGYGSASCFFLFWRAGCSHLRAEGFSCSLDVLYGDLGISKLQFLIKKIKSKFFFVVNFFQYLVIKTLDPDPHWYSA